VEWERQTGVSSTSDFPHCSLCRKAAGWEGKTREASEDWTLCCLCHCHMDCFALGSDGMRPVVRGCDLQHSKHRDWLCESPLQVTFSAAAS
jgi:hypothetical protein